MQKLIFYSLVIALINNQSGFCFGSEKTTMSHYDRLKKEYPFALLTNDFGILSPEDLAMNSCDTDPIVFSENSHAYPYWQCFSTNLAMFECDPAGFDDESKKETAILYIHIIGEREQIDFIPRRAMDMDNCQWFQRKWKNLTKNQKNVCLLGTYSNRNEEHHKSIKVTWIFDKFKTKIGCSSYFYGQCSAQYLRKNGCQI